MVAFNTIEQPAFSSGNESEIQMATNTSNKGQETISMSVDAISEIVSKFRNEDRSIPTFRGNVLDWPLFIKKYRDTTSAFNISDDANYKRLDKALRGQARILVRDQLSNQCFVGDVIRILEATYGNRHNIMAKAMQEVEKLPKLNLDLGNLESFTHEVTKVQIMMKHCGMESSMGTLRRLVVLLPRPQRHMWAMHEKTLEESMEGSITDFVQWLEQQKTECLVNNFIEDTTEKRQTTERRTRRYSPYNSRKRNDSPNRDHYWRSNRVFANRRYDQFNDRNLQVRRPELNDRPRRFEIPTANRVMTNQSGPDTPRCVICCETDHQFQE